MIPRTQIPLHLPKSDLLTWLGQNKGLLAHEKKMAGKVSDGFSFQPLAGFNDLSIKDASGKSVNLAQAKAASKGKLPEYGADMKGELAINSTNWMDSHLDVHMKGLWKKNLQESKMLMHLQEHRMEFEKIISDGDDLKAFTKEVTFKSLGWDYKGTTELLIFDSTIKRARNEYMYDQYYKGYVKNHSVFIQYVKFVLCVNEPDNNNWGAEYEAWEKYIPEVANKDFAEEVGFFWAVLEGKIIEGSAVPRGSNIVTPTLSMTSKGEPLDEGTPNPEPVITTTQNVLKALQTKNIFLE